MNRVLVYTIAMDRPGQTIYGHMAKILVSSLLRTYFTGDVLIIHNGSAPLFRVERRNVDELILDGNLNKLDQKGSKSLKYQARQWIKGYNYDWVCFLDCDMIALRNIDHLFDPGAECEILWQPEGKMKQSPYNSFFFPEEYSRLWRDGANSGSFAVRGQCYEAVMAEWERIDAGEPISQKVLQDQPAWNRLLFDTKLRTRRLEKEEILFPLLIHHQYRKWRRAALLHANGQPNDIKLEFLIGQFLGRFTGEPAGLILSLLEP